MTEQADTIEVTPDLIGRVAWDTRSLIDADWALADADKALLRLAGYVDAGNVAEFVNTTVGAITESARFNSFRGNWNHVHVVADAAYHLAKRFPTADCPNHNAYHRAWVMAYREQGHRYDESPICRCPKDV